MALCLGALLLFALSTSVFATGNDDGDYGEYGSFKELYDAYYVAIENGDIDKQNELLALAQADLDRRIAEADSRQTRVDPDYEYYLGLFPTYFSSGYWGSANEGYSLALHHIRAFFWSPSDVTNAWNSVYAKFGNDSQWANTGIMREQFYCHARLFYELIPDDWNLEPWRTSMGPIDCN